MARDQIVEFPQRPPVDAPQRLHLRELRAEPTFPSFTVRPVMGAADDYVLVCNRHGIASLPDGYAATSAAVCPGCTADMELGRYALTVRLLEGRC